jgi:hypothetical protein
MPGKAMLYGPKQQEHTILKAALRKATPYIAVVVGGAFGSYGIYSLLSNANDREAAYGAKVEAVHAAALSDLKRGDTTAATKKADSLVMLNGQQPGSAAIDIILKEGNVNLAFKYMAMRAGMSDQWDLREQIMTLDSLVSAKNVKK